MEKQSLIKARRALAQHAKNKAALQDRAEESLEQRRARVSGVVGRMRNSVLPDFPPDMLEGFNLFFAVMNDPRDPVEARIAAGYSVVQASEIPERYRNSEMVFKKATYGDYGECVVAAEHLLMKIPKELWQDYMWYLHHDRPYQTFEDRIASEARRAAAAQHHSGRITVEDGVQMELDNRYQEPSF